MASRASRVAVFLAAALPALAAYVASLNPTVPAGDSGELIAVAATLGVAHPPGYPLYTWLGHLWLTLVPWGNVAWRLNLFSATCGALAAGVLALAVLKLTRSTAAALVAAWTLAFSAPSWKYAEVAEVFVPNALLASLVLLAAAEVLAPAQLALAASPLGPAGRARVALPSYAALAFLAALEFSHHHTLVLLLGPVLLLIVLLHVGPDRLRAALLFPRLPRPGARDLVVILIAAAAGLVPLIHLFVSPGSDRGLVWGDPGTWKGFLRHLLRVDYGSLRLDPLEAAMRADRSHVVLYLESLPRGIGPLAILLGGVGLVDAASRRRALALALGGFAAAQAWFFTRVGFPSGDPVLRGVVERFYILPNLVVALFAGLGAAAILAWRPGVRARPRGGHAKASRRPGAPPPRERKAVNGTGRHALSLSRLAAALLALAALAWPLATHARLVSQRGNRFAEHLGRTVLASLPARAVLFVQGDLFHNALQYLTWVERLRPDVTVVAQELMTYDWYLRRLRRQHPDLLPPFGRAERIRLRDGTVLEGLALARADGTTDLLVEDGQSTVASSTIAAIEPVADPSGLYARTRRGFRQSWLLPRVEDRYSGLPGTRNLLWLDHLAGRRPVAFIGAKDQSWGLRYELIPIGLVAVAYPRGRAPAMPERIERTLAVLSEAELDDYFHRYDPWSFEATERQFLAELVRASALLLCQPQAAEAARGARAQAGRDRLLAFARRFEALDPTPDPACLRAIGFLRMFDPGFRDPQQARRDLERYLATAPPGPEADEARGALRQIESAR
jgi:transmembrane protein TMEM260 (protein O-mannosyltransferase)